MHDSQIFSQSVAALYLIAKNQKTPKAHKQKIDEQTVVYWYNRMQHSNKKEQMTQKYGWNLSLRHYFE